MSNFAFLNTNWPDLYATAFEAEHNLASAPLTSLKASAQSPEN